MKYILSLPLDIAGAIVGIYLLLPETTYFLKAASGHLGASFLTFRQVVEHVGAALPCLSLVLLPVLRILRKLSGDKLRSALVVLVFSGLSVELARVFQPFLMDFYAFLISAHKVWKLFSVPASSIIFAVIAVNWGAYFAELYRVTKLVGKGAS